MQVSRGIPERANHPSVLSIGNFDGIHLGHQRLLALLRDKARSLGLPATVLTFEPHPREFFAPGQAPARLASMREKLMRLADHGIDRAVVLRFDARLAGLSADEFVTRVLVRGLGVRHLIIGDDFRFGARRAGDFDTLRAAGAEYRFAVEAMPTLEAGGERVSSSAVRGALAAGDLARARELLGRPYSMAGRVVHGDKIGRSLGYPTANIKLHHRLPPLAGIFAVAVEGLSTEPMPAVASLGVRPTVTDSGRHTLEVHLFDHDADCYGAHLRVSFLHKLRCEEKFASLQALTEQIARDTQAAHDWFAHNPF